jgi:hypothetical protein
MRKHNTYNNPCWFGGVGVIVDSLSSGFWSSLTTPPVAIRNKEELFLGKFGKTRQLRFWGCLIMFFPSVVCRSYAASIRNVLTKSKMPVDVERLRILFGGSKIRVLVDEALSPLFEGFDRLIIPPISKVSNRVVVSSRRIECYSV